ncbi:TIGR01777 family oxidoreductase [Marinobacter lacisalsi]|uniref:TIGR01777 family oxidoreductase n=1 Tax=Marinobacter lacisalsi TaxID=475979 RepID=A0ABV8QF31_9GAMM
MTDKRILVTGGTGFIGRVLCPNLLEAGYEVDVLSRQKPEDVRAICGRVTPIRHLTGLGERPGYDAVVNLAGEGIAEKRWTEPRKQVLRDSRIALTRELVSALLSHEKLPHVMVSGSAVGYYGAQGEAIVTEKSAPNDEFSHRLCADWEKAASPLTDQGVRVCYSRTGVVAGSGGGFLERMVLPFKLGLGGRIGNGSQYMPWVHRQDVVNAILWMLSEESASGPYNVVSPNPVTNRTFTRTLADVLGRPALFPVPATVLKLALGEMSRLLLTGQRATPERLEQEGFRFTWPELKPALKEALGK